MSGKWPFTAEKIATRLNLIEPHIFRRRKVLPNFKLLQLSEAIVEAPICADPTGWDEIGHNSYWGSSDLNFVLKNTFSIPHHWDAGNIALHLPLGVMGDIFNHPEALVHVDTKPIASADRYHHTIPLDARLQDGKSHVLSLHGWTGHAGWPFDANSKAKLFMGEPALVERDQDLLEFYGLAKAALDASQTLADESEESINILKALDDAFRHLDTRDPIGIDFYDSVGGALEVLEQGIGNAGQPLDVRLHGIGHAHMDIAYLWPISQIRLKNARTYSNVLRLMDADPTYKFSHSQPQLYDYTARDYPDIFDGIKKRVHEGRWEIMGGMWVEPDLNIAGAEALVRQLMLGRQYYRDTFCAEDTPVLWLPDTFGFPGQVPQLMRHAGLKWFATNKLNWNQRNKVPSTTHHWEGIDGSRVLAHILTTPRDVQYLPFPTNYKSDLSAAEVLGTWQYSSAPSTVRELPICYGYGDGGGGPTEELLARADAYAAMPGMPQLHMSTVRETFERLEENVDDLPTWQGEHYMEGHRGVLTSQAWIKRANRKAEWALHEAEALCVMAGMTADLEEAWKLLCLNQFHDIITGTSVSVVFDDAREDFKRIRQMTESVATAAANKLALPTLSVANTSPVSGPRISFVADQELATGQEIDGGCLVYFNNLAAYSITPVSAASIPDDHASCELVDGGAVLENAKLRVKINAQGQLSGLFDKVADRSALAFGAIGNVLQAFEDRPICWDAWDIDPFFEERQENIDTNCTFHVIENGPLRAALKIVRTWRNSQITQIVRLITQSSRVDFETEIDWHETHTLLKVAFPASVQSTTAQFDIQWGTIERSTTRDNDFDAARFEVPAQKWAQLSENGYSVAVLNDCKYGYDVHGDTIRLTLIKSPTYPDPKADQGKHRFTYSLLSNGSDNREILNQAAYDLNAPLRIIEPYSKSVARADIFVEQSEPNVIIETIKPAADGNGVVIRLFEAEGKAVTTSLQFAKFLLSATKIDFMEQDADSVEIEAKSMTLGLSKFEILSLRVVFA